MSSEASSIPIYIFSAKYIWAFAISQRTQFLQQYFAMPLLDRFSSSWYLYKQIQTYFEYLYIAIHQEGADHFFQNILIIYMKGFKSDWMMMLFIRRVKSELLATVHCSLVFCPAKLLRGFPSNLRCTVRPILLLTQRYGLEEHPSQDMYGSYETFLIQARASYSSKRWKKFNSSLKKANDCSWK